MAVPEPAASDRSECQERTKFPKKARIAIDAMGGDLGPGEIVAAVDLAYRTLPELESIILVGHEDQLGPLVQSQGLDRQENLRIHHASEVVEMHDHPLQALKRKKDASIFRAIELVKAGEAEVIVSCGNTGSLMAAGTLKLRMMEGVDRPAIATVIPSKGSHFILIDAGANPSARPRHLVHNAILGSVYCQLALGVAEPRVGLLTIGTEEGKGTDLVHETHQLLKKVDSVVNYRGPIEGFHVFDNHVDVIVCDGFVGNILLKTCESLFKLLKGYLKEELMRNLLRKTGAFLAKGAFQDMKAHLDPEQYGGAPLLGLRGNVLKAHGSSNRHALMHAIRIAHEMIAREMNLNILHEIQRANELIGKNEDPPN